MYIKIINNIKTTKGNITNYIYDNLDTNKGSFILNTNETLCICDYDGNIDKNKNLNTIEISKEEYNNLLNEINAEKEEERKEYNKKRKSKEDMLNERINALEIASANQLGK